MYKIAIYNGKERLECYTAYTDYYRARSHFKAVCKTYRELPLDSICSLEHGSEKLEAYRFTKDHNTLPVDTLSSSLGEMVGRRASFTSPHQRRPSTEILNAPLELPMRTSEDTFDAEGDSFSDLSAEPTLQEPIEQRAVLRKKYGVLERIRKIFCAAR